jgi:hypothetical protein
MQRMNIEYQGFRKKLSEGHLRATHTFLEAIAVPHEAS